MNFDFEWHHMRNKILLLITAFSFSTFITIEAQVLKNLLGTSTPNPVPSNEVLIQNYRAELAELTQAKYTGRALGTVGFRNISAHLERRMQQLGLIRYGTTGYRSTYKFPTGRIRTVETKFYVDGKSLYVGTDVLPMPFGAAEEVVGHLLPTVNAAYGPWTMALPNEQLDQENIYKKLRPAILNAQERGATAVYFYDNSNAGSVDLKKLDIKEAIVDEDIQVPVWLISKKTWTEHFKNVTSLIHVQSSPKYKTNFEDGYNIVGLIDHKAQKTVVIMADYDQLFPEHENSAGANANASGVAIMLQLSQILKEPAFKQYNYAFAAFSGSSKKSLGVRSFLGIPEMKSRIAYAIDLTAVGKMNTKGEIFINGVASANMFKTAVRAASDTYRPRLGEDYPYDASYLSFIEAGVPVMSFSTGFKGLSLEHDNMAAVNFVGMANTTRFVVGVIGKVNEAGTPPVFAMNPMLVKDEDLVVPKVMPATVQRSSGPGRTQDNRTATSQRLAQAKNNLRNNQGNTRSPGRPTAQPTPKLAVEQPYFGDANVVIDVLGLGINELDEREGGAVIQSVDEKGKASALGLKAGDIVVQIGSMPVFNAKAYLLTLQKYKEGERAYYKVKKSDGKTVMVNVEF